MIVRITDWKIVECRLHVDVRGLLEELGIGSRLRTIGTWTLPDAA
jgi:hypothetical protein